MEATKSYGVFDEDGRYVQETHECPECGGRDGAHEYDCPNIDGNLDELN